MPIYYDNSKHVGNKGIFYTKSKCVPVSAVTVPTIGGTIQVGFALSVDNAIYNGSTPITIVNKWYRSDGTYLATGSTYFIQNSDVGYSLYVVETASNSCSSLDQTTPLTAPVPPAFNYLFDQFTAQGVTPYAGFSFRKLSSTYAGSCCRIRRSNDNAELDIGFVSNVVDVASIQAFVPIGASGQVVRMYDQTGNGRDRYQSVANRQPDIIDTTGALFTQNGKYVARIPNGTKCFSDVTANKFWQVGDNTAFEVYKNTQAAQSLLMVGGVNQYGYVADSGIASSSYGQSTTFGNRKNNAVVTINTRGEAYTNLATNTLISHVAGINLQGTWSFNLFGGYNSLGGGYDWTGYYAEEVWVNSNVIGNVTLLNNVWTNQQSYYTL